MTTIVAFPARIEITTALVRETRHHSASGVSTTRHDPPVRTYWLEFIDGDGRAIIWDGSSHADALAEAHVCATDGVVIRDRTAAP